jgi:hypothetical protein
MGRSLSGGVAKASPSKGVGGRSKDLVGDNFHLALKEISIYFHLRYNTMPQLPNSTDFQVNESLAGDRRETLFAAL